MPKDKSKKSNSKSAKKRKKTTERNDFDPIYKRMFGHPEVLVGFMDTAVQEDFVKYFDFDTITYLPNEFISEKLRKKYSDIIYKVKWKGKDSYVIIITEFQSTVDRWICVRILAYMVLLWLDLVLRKMVTAESGLPPVFPIILYRGTTEWTAPVEISKLLSKDAAYLMKYQPSFKFLLIKEKDLTDSLLSTNKNFFSLFERIMRAKNPDEIKAIFDEYDEEFSDGRNYEIFLSIRSIVQSVFNKIQCDTKNQIIIPTKYEELNSMFDNLARWHRDEVEAAQLLGEQIGEQRGKQIGEQIGEQRGSIKTMIEVLSSFGVGKNDTIEKLSTKFTCSKKEAEDYYKLYHNS